MDNVSMNQNDLTQEEWDKMNQNRAEEKQFAKNLRKLLTGDKKIERSLIRIGKTPNIVVACSCYGELDLYISVSTLRKCMRAEARGENHQRLKHSRHNLSEQQINNVVWAIKRPLLMCRGTQKNTFGLMTDIRDNKGNNIFVFVSLNQDKEFNKVNVISSAYGKENMLEFLKDRARKNRIVAINTDKADELRRSVGGDFPEETSYIGFDSTIAYSMKSVKWIPEY